MTELSLLSTFHYCVCIFNFIFLCRQGTTSHDSYSEDMYRALLERYHQLDQEMSAVALEWLECEKRIDDYVDEQVYFVGLKDGNENKALLN